MAAAREYDIVVFGATGFTGRRVAQNLATSSGFKGKWAIAGRDRARLDALAASLSASSPGVLVADATDAASLAAMAAAAAVVINTVGPFRLYSQPVVAACVASGTDYLDVCGEPDFIERVELEFDEAARDKGVYVASACGFDSVPGEFAVQYTMSLFRPPARCTSVETALTIHAGPAGFRGHYATFQSAVLGFAGAGELRRLRKEAEQKRGKALQPVVPGPKPARQAGAAWDPRFRAYTYPFMGADASVVRRTMRSQDRPAHVSVVFTLPSRTSLALWQGFGAAFAWLAQRDWGRDLLLRYPRLFSYGLFTHEGPSEEQMAGTSFSFTSVGKGYSQGAPETPGQAPDMELYTRVSGPEPGYIACSVFVVQAAVTLLEERGRLPAPGVHTPASLLRGTTYVDRLRAHGITFEQVDSAAVPQ